MKMNCWEHMRCGREVGGRRVDDFGVCPAATDAQCDGVNGGRNAGRICWAVSGTFCGGAVQGTFAQKVVSCMGCDFFCAVLHEEGRGLVMQAPGPLR